MSSGEPFYFSSRSSLIRLLGIKAENVSELINGIETVPADSIYFHTHRFLEQHHYLTALPRNDFAYWVSSLLKLEDLGEMLAWVDVIKFGDMEEVRAEFLRLLRKWHGNNEHREAACAEGQEFFFLGVKVFIIPTSYAAHSLSEFLEIIRNISIDSIYFHIFEARMRLKRNDNDFSAWLKGIGENELARRIALLDPYSMNLEALREELLKLGAAYGKDTN
jgi:hypothetical protein